MEMNNKQPVYVVYSITQPALQCNYTGSTTGELARGREKTGCRQLFTVQKFGINVFSIRTEDFLLIDV